VNVWSKVGVMIRESLAANSTHAMMIISSTSGAAFQRRVTTGGNSTGTTVTGPAAPYWVRLVRTGNSFSGSVSTDGANWTLVGSVTINMSSNALIGLAITSHSPGVLCTGTIDSVTKTGN